MKSNQTRSTIMEVVITVVLIGLISLVSIYLVYRSSEPKRAYSAENFVSERTNFISLASAQVYTVRAGEKISFVFPEEKGWRITPRILDADPTSSRLFYRIEKGDGLHEWVNAPEWNREGRIFEMGIEGAGRGVKLLFIQQKIPKK